MNNIINNTNSAIEERVANGEPATFESELFDKVDETLRDPEEFPRIRVIETGFISEPKKPKGKRELKASAALH